MVCTFLQKAISVLFDEILNQWFLFLDQSIFNGLQGIPSWTYNIRPPPYLLRSHLKILKPFIWNCLFGKVSSSLDSDIRNILKFSINSANISYLFLKELILRIKVTYYYSAWITQTLSFDVSEVISWLFK